jgi:hypothetical protein
VKGFTAMTEVIIEGEVLDIFIDIALDIVGELEEAEILEEFGY